MIVIQEQVFKGTLRIKFSQTTCVFHLNHSRIEFNFQSRAARQKQSKLELSSRKKEMLFF